MSTRDDGLVYVVVRFSKGKIVDLGPELFRSEDDAWKAADALNGARRRFKAAGSSSVEPATFEVISRRLLAAGPTAPARPTRAVAA
jgi:hypothetical protein